MPYESDLRKDENSFPFVWCRRLRRAYENGTITLDRESITYDRTVSGNPPGFLNWSSQGFGEDRLDTIHATVEIIKF